MLPSRVSARGYFLWCNWLAGNLTNHIDNESGISYNFEYNGQKYFYRKNLQGDIIGIYDSCWNLLGLYEYDAWGNSLSQVGSEILNINPFRYRGYYYDAETGLYYLNSRYYDPEIGRFISPDSLKYLDPTYNNGLNLYTYCLINPVNCKFKAIYRHKFLAIESGYFDYSLISPEMFTNIHWANQWFDTGVPGVLIFSNKKAALFDWSFSLYKGALYFDKEEYHSIYVSIANVSAFAGYNSEDAQFGVFADINVCTVGYDGKYVDASVSLIGVGFIIGLENGKLRIKLDPPGWFGFDISIDFGKIIQDLFGG